MTKDGSGDGRIVDPDSLPAKFPTHRHEGRFWESLGRAVGTFGFLEEVLSKAIFALSATKPYDRAEIDAAYEKWARRLEKALTDPLGNLIEDYEKTMREHPDATTEDLDYLIGRLREASRIRNVLCHGSWQVPDSQGASVSVVCRQEAERLRRCGRLCISGPDAAACCRTLLRREEFGDADGMAISGIAGTGQANRPGMREDGPWGGRSRE